MEEWTQFERELVSACKEDLSGPTTAIDTQKTWLATARELLRQASGQQPGAALVISSPEGVDRVPLDDPVQTLGRSDDCTVRLPYRFVSRHHARLRKIDADWAFEDLGSANGTLVNGVLCSQKTLIAGDVLQIGEATLLFLPADAGLVGEDLG